MQELLELLGKRVKTLRKAIKKASVEKESFPPGRLRVLAVGKKKSYYLIPENKESREKYISKKNSQLITLLAQKSYNRQFIKVAEKELALLENALSKLHQVNADMVYQTLSSTRQSLVTPYIKTKEMIVQEWSDAPCKTNNYMEENKRYDTKRGERVRSKSEAILADMFLELGIPYRYEQEIHLRDGRVRYPDFTLFKVDEQKEIYLEHLGLLDNEEYRSSNLRKIDEYRDSGIYLGINLLITYETEDSPLDIRGIRKMLKEIFGGS